MAMTSRGRRRYYYRTERRNGRAVRVYVGAGDVAELAAAVDEVARMDVAIAKRERLAEQARRQQAEAPLLELCKVSDLLVRAALTAAGFHQHARGKWRKRREQGSEG